MGANIGRALRAALAAGLAWLAVQPLGGIAETYPYYAPLGAVVAVTASVIGSVRESLQTITAMALGVGIAVASTPFPQLVSLLGVVAVGTALMTSDRLSALLGNAASWVPVTGMFVLVIGGDSPWGYALAYVGLTTLGAAIGLVVNALWPPLPLRAESRTLARVRDSLADRLDAVAESLRADLPPTPDEWATQTDDLDVLVGQMRTVASQAGELRRVNWRLRRWEASAAQRYLEARALERLAFLVEDLGDLLADREHAEREHVALGPDLRPHAAAALAALAGVLRSVDGGLDDRAVSRATDAQAALVQAMRRVREATGDDLITAGGVVTAIDRTLSSLEPVRDGVGPASPPDLQKGPR